MLYLGFWLSHSISPLLEASLSSAGTGAGPSGCSGAAEDEDEEDTADWLTTLSGRLCKDHRSTLQKGCCSANTSVRLLLR